MKKKILYLTILCVTTLGIMVGCTNKAKAEENTPPPYMTWCGENDMGNGRVVEIYEDIVHHKVVYVSLNYSNNAVSTSVSDMGK